MRRALKRALTVLAVGGLTASGAVTAVAPASADTATTQACYSAAGLPARVSIDRAYQEVRVSLRDSCYNDYVSAYLYGPTGLEDVFIWDPAYNGAVEYWGLYGYATVPGTYRSREVYASPTDNGVETSTIAKFGSKAGLTARRSGSRVNFTACASYYNGQRDAFVPWAGNRATIQQLASDGRTWRYVRTVTTNRSGCGTYTLSNRYSGTYRVTTYETYQIFGRTSPGVRA